MLARELVFQLRSGDAAFPRALPGWAKAGWVVTQGGLGTIDLGSAEQDGDVITFNFKTFLCPSKPANTTFFFGLASAHPPASTLAGVFVTASPPYYNVPARAP